MAESKYYYIKVQKAETEEIREHEKLEVKTSIENIVLALVSYGWITINYHQVYEDDSETKSVQTSVNSEEVEQEVI